MYSPNHQRHKPVGCIRRLLAGIVSVCRAFCLQTTIHGFNHIAAPKRHWVERLLWAGVTATAAWGVFDVSLGQWQRYRDNPTVVTLEKDFRSWSYTMMGVTACNQNRTDPKKVVTAIKTRWQVTPDDPKYNYYFKFVDLVTNSDIYHLDGYKDFVNDTDLNVDLYKLAVDVMPDLNVKVTFDHIPSAPPGFVPVMTEVGACQTINSVAAPEIAIVKPNPNETKKLPVTCKYNAQGCTFNLESFEPMQFYFHSAYDIPDTTSKPYATYMYLTITTELNIMETCAGPGVRDLSPRRRNCLYTDEPTEPGRQVHSTAICQQGCKSRLVLKLCGCKPFYYFYTEGPLCTPAGMLCVARMAARLPTFDNTKCPCKQLCVDSAFYESSTTSQLKPTVFKMRGKANFKVLPPQLRYTRTIVFHFQDLVVSFGGAAGLFLGASFISFVEIAYFLIDSILGIGRKKKEPKPSIKIPAAAYENRIQELTSILERQNYKRRYLFE